MDQRIDSPSLEKSTELQIYRSKHAAIRARIIRLELEERRLAHWIQILQSYPNLAKYANKLGCNNIDVAGVRFSILDYICSMKYGMGAREIFANIKNIHLKITYGGVRVHLYRMSKLDLFENKKRDQNWIANDNGRNLHKFILRD